MPKAALVMTTVNGIGLLDGYRDNFEKHGHLDDVTVYVIPDEKTPNDIYVECGRLIKRGLNVVCPSLSEQDDFLLWAGFPPALIPRNSDNRRNVGYLMALSAGSDFMISIDDDNYICDQSGDYFHAHSIVCDAAHFMTVAAPARQSTWFNPAQMLDGAGNAYARGYPYFARTASQPPIETELGKQRIAANAGLWLCDMDLDAMTWLAQPGKATGLVDGLSLALQPGQWGPVNTQNTAIHRNAIAAFWFVRMGYPIGGLSIDRYGDIFSGYFLQACAKSLGETVRYGTPLVEHKRNAHNYLRDVRQEYACIAMLEDLLPWLTDVELGGNNYQDAYRSLSYQLCDYVETLHGSAWDAAAKGYIHRIAYTMQLWANTCEDIS